MVYTNTPSKIIGDAPVNILSDDVKQLFDNSCAIKSQQLILQRFGIYIPEEKLYEEAVSNGWYHEGTSPEDVGKLLELHGIPVAQYENANIFNLVNELAQGHQVIVGVDSGELWGDNIFDIVFEDNKADHALVVSGVDTSDPNNIKVILTDPGTGDLLKEYPLDQFVDAWQDSKFFMMTTQNPMPNIFDSFNTQPGIDLPITNIPSIGHMPYEMFYNDFAFLNYTNEIPSSVFNDFSDYVTGDISSLSPETMNFFDNLIM